MKYAEDNKKYLEFLTKVLQMMENTPNEAIGYLNHDAVLACAHYLTFSFYNTDTKLTQTEVDRFLEDAMEFESFEEARKYFNCNSIDEFKRDYCYTVTPYENIVTLYEY